MHQTVLSVDKAEHIPATAESGRKRPGDTCMDNISCCCGGLDQGSLERAPGRFLQ
jgi:hypothetical protein